MSDAASHADPMLYAATLGGAVEDRDDEGPAG
jgi:hypothetical protein